MNTLGIEDTQLLFETSEGSIGPSRAESAVAIGDQFESSLTVIEVLADFLTVVLAMSGASFAYQLWRPGSILPSQFNTVAFVSLAIGGLVVLLLERDARVSRREWFAADQRNGTITACVCAGLPARRACNVCNWSNLLAVDLFDRIVERAAATNRREATSLCLCMCFARTRLRCAERSYIRCRRKRAPHILLIDQVSKARPQSGCSC